MDRPVEEDPTNNPPPGQECFMVAGRTIRLDSKMK